MTCKHDNIENIKVHREVDLHSPICNIHYIFLLFTVKFVKIKTIYFYIF